MAKALLLSLHQEEAKSANSLLNLADVTKKMKCICDKLSSSSCPPSSFHHHFAISMDSLQRLERNFCSSSERFITYFFDTADFKLSHMNWWLIFQLGNWILKQCVKQSSNEQLIAYHIERDRETIEVIVAKALGVDRDKLEVLCPNEWAVLRTERRTYHTLLYVDSVELADNDFYVVGTLGFSVKDEASEEEWPANVLETLEVMSPVRSRVAEFIHERRPALATSLIRQGVLLDKTYSGEGFNHFPTDPFEELPMNKPIGPCKETQLIPSTETRYREPDDTDAAQEEWLRYCRENPEEEEYYFGGEDREVE